VHYHYGMNDHIDQHPTSDAYES